MLDREITIPREAYRMLEQIFLTGKLSGDDFELDLTKVQTFAPDWKSNRIKINPPAPLLVKSLVKIRTTISELVLIGDSIYVEVDNSVVDLRIRSK